MEAFHVSEQLPLLAGAAVVAYLSTVLYGILYNAYLHPLKNYPGPFWARATPLPVAYHRFFGSQHTWLGALHEQYGDVVRYVPDQLSYTNPLAWKDIFGHKLNGRGDIPKLALQEVETAIVGGKDSILLMDDDDHARARRLVSPALSDKALREQQPLMNKYVQLLVDRIRDVAVIRGHGKIDLASFYTFTTFDIIADLAFGESFGMLQQGEWVPWIFALNSGIHIGDRLAVFNRFLPTLGWVLMKCIPQSVFEPVYTHISYSIRQVDKRIARETERPDFWKYIMRNQEKEIGTLSLKESHAMGQTLILAGSETTAALLSGLTNFLLNNRDKYDKLTGEIRESFAAVEDINIDSLMSLPYLGACLREALRLYPPAPLGQLRRVPAGGRMVVDQFVPENTIVTVTHWAASRSSQLWYKSDEFLPERWLPENQTSGPFANDARDALQPFSFGPRNCVGKNLAYHEMRLILANVLWTFDLDLCEESKNWSEQKVFALPARPPLMVTPKIVKNGMK